MKKLAVLLVLFFAGCAASQENLDRVAQIEVIGLAKSSRALSTFAAYELKPMTLYPEVQEKADKVVQAGVLEGKIQAKLVPLFDEWAASNEPSRSGTLVVQPELVKLRIVSGGARFFTGAFTGSSFIDLDLVLIDGDTSSQLVKTRIRRDASGLGGAWSFGKTDENLHDYIAQITHRYMVESY